MKDLALRICAIIFLLASVIHLCRLILKIEITVGSHAMPVWLSIFGFIAPLCLALWIFSLLKKR